MSAAPSQTLLPGDRNCTDFRCDLPGFDPETLHGLHDLVRGHLELHDIPMDPSLGLAVVVNATAQTGIAASSDIDQGNGTELWINRNVAVDQDVALVSVGVLAVLAVAAVVTVVVVVAFVGVTSETSLLINGESATLFRDSMIANITEQYAT